MTTEPPRAPPDRQARFPAGVPHKFANVNHAVHQPASTSRRGGLSFTHLDSVDAVESTIANIARVIPIPVNRKRFSKAETEVPKLNVDGSSPFTRFHVSHVELPLYERASGINVRRERPAVARKRFQTAAKTLGDDVVTP